MFATLKATQSEHRQKIHNQFGWVIVHFLVAVVLLIAAGLKGHQLITTPLFLGEGLFHARGLNQMAVIFELSLGIWLLSGLLQKTAWLVSLVLFTLFAGISLYKAAILHETSCRCFGAVVIPPAWTATFDLIIVGLLLAFRPKKLFFIGKRFFKN
jgi:hypothetical protein